MRTTIIVILFSLHLNCVFGEVPDSISISLSDFGVDSVMIEYWELKQRQGKLSDCEFGKKIANDDFAKNNYLFLETKGLNYLSTLYNDVLLNDYHVKMIFSDGIFSDEYYKCYNEEMKRLLFQKHGFNIFEKSYQKKDSLLNMNPIPTPHQNHPCIPVLIRNERLRTYIKDPCIDDTLIVRFLVEVHFEHSLIDPQIPMVVEKVVVKKMNIRSKYIYVDLSPRSKIENSFHQYIWDLVSAKLSYWYKNQPYHELPRVERVKLGNSIILGRGLWLVPQ